MNKVKQEPVLTWSTIHAIFNVLQIVAIPMAPWLHAVIMAVTAITAALAARSQVTPTPPSFNGRTDGSQPSSGGSIPPGGIPNQ